MEQQASIPPPLDQTIGQKPSAPSILKPVDPHRTDFNQRNFQDVNPPSYSRSVASPPLHTPTRYKGFEPPAADTIIRYRFVWVADAIGKVAGNGGNDSFFRVMKTPHAETFGNKGITITISPSPLLGREHPCIVDVRCKSLRLLFTCRYDPDAKDFSHFVFTRDEKAFEENGLNAHTQNVAFATCSISMQKNHINQSIEVCDENGNKFLFMVLDVGLEGWVLVLREASTGPSTLGKLCNDDVGEEEPALADD